MNRDSNIVKLVTEGYRLENAYLLNPLFATETSLIDILPHQLVAVYDILVKRKKLRFLLADDAGAGKTIMAGLYIREMLSRKLVNRVLVIPPAGLVGNWQNELDNLFRLKFNIIKGNEIKENSENIFSSFENNLAIISIDTICRDKAKSLYIEALPYDLVIFDEAHKLSARRDYDLTEIKSNRYKIAELIAKQNRNLLLMTATPHMGKEESYFYLWKLLEPTIFSNYKLFQRLSQSDKKSYILRRMKEDMVFFNGQPIFPKRESKTISYTLSEKEKELYEVVTDYCKNQYDLAGFNNKSASRLAMMVLQRRLASSTLAILKSLERRRDKLREFIRQLDEGNLSNESFIRNQNDLPFQDYREDKTSDEEEIIDGYEESEFNDNTVLAATNAKTIEDLKTELEQVEFLVKTAEDVYYLKHESKFEKLWEALEDYKDTKVLIFTEHRDTLEFIINRLEGKGYYKQIAFIHGGVDYIERKKMVDKFRSDDCMYMVATDAAGEGLNMQFCWVLVNYDIPWNPARIEQRMGRIHRYKQTHDVLLLNLVAEDTREGKVLKVLLEKLDKIREELGDKVFDIIGEQLKDISLSELIQNSIERQNSNNFFEEEIDSKFTKENFRKSIEEQKQKVECSDVKKLLEGWKERQKSNEILRLMPAFVRLYLQDILQFFNIQLIGDIQGVFSFNNLPENISKYLLQYEEHLRDKFTFEKSLAISKHSFVPSAIYLHPGEVIYDAISNWFLEKYSDIAKKGAVFFDPLTNEPYIFYLAKILILKSKDIQNKELLPNVETKDVVDQILIGIKKFQNNTCKEIPTHLLLDLFPVENIQVNIPSDWIAFAEESTSVKDFVLQKFGIPKKEEFVKEYADKIPDLEKQINESLNLLSAELLEQRMKLKKDIEKGVPAAKSKLEKCTKELQGIEDRKKFTIHSLHVEAKSFEVSPVTIYSMAYVFPIPEDQDFEQFNGMKRDDRIEKIAMDKVFEYERERGANCEDVSDPSLRKGFDILSIRQGEERFIEVKGRATQGHIALSANEWRQAANHREKYFLYVVFHCATKPIIHIVKDPFGKLIGKMRGVIIDAFEILENEEKEE
ncbi:MAG: DUF3883 domain-containing protein [Leptospiraceae bacterium]|nr:DUF3883 domain-containing protein [Leptospiraceae bacterium]